MTAIPLITEADLVTGKHDDDLVASMMASIETPLRTLVALNAVVTDGLESITAKEIAAAAMEDGVVDLVTSALALITMAWEQAGLNLEIGVDRNPTPEVAAWCEQILAHAIIHAQMKFFALRLDYAFNVGSIPFKTRSTE